MDGSTNMPLKTNQIIIAAVLILFLFRFAGPFRFLFLVLLMLAALGITVYFIWNAIKRKKAQQLFEQSIEGITNKKMSYCDEQIEKNEEEVVTINESISEIKKKIEETEGLSQHKKAEAQKLIRAFETELQLRRAKIDFFRTAKKKLYQLQRNKQLDQTIANKEEELKRLKEHHYDDLADMEELRADMELETLYLNTIESLSLQLHESTSPEGVNALQQELEEMTKDLN